MIIELLYFFERKKKSNRSKTLF